MLHPYSIEERPSIIPDVLNYVNGITRSQILDMMNRISKDYSIDMLELMEIYKNNNMRLHLGGNVHYPPPQESRCKARIRGRGFGNSQCKRKCVENGLCKRHLKQYNNCVEAGCERGKNGLGACSGHKGLRLGFIDCPIPHKNEEGKVVVKWKREVVYKTRTTSKIKRVKKYKVKKITKPTNTDAVVDKPKFTKKYLYNEVNSLMRTLDLDDGSITTDTIIKRLQLHLQSNLDDYTTILEDCIYDCFDKITAEELEEPDDEMFKKPVNEDDLVETFYGETKILLHKESNEIFNAQKKIIGYWTGKEPVFYKTV